jgi:integrase/recombinase XerD
VRDGAIMALLVGCGVRVSGLVKLNQGHVIEQVVEGKPRLFLRVIEKGDRERLVPVPPEADLQLRVYLEHPQLKEIDRSLPNGDLVLFVSTRNRSCPQHEYHGERRRLNRRAVLEMIGKYGKQQGIPEEQLHPHAMRHLYGTELAEDDVHLLVAQQLLGHVDPKSTQIYTHLAIRKLVTEVDRANPLSKMRTPTTDILKRLQS